MAGVISGQYRTPVAALTATSGTPLEVLVDEYGRLIVNATVTGGSGTSSNFDAAFPTAGTAAGFLDGSGDMQGARTYDLGGGFATENVLGTILRASSMAGSVETGTTTNPLYVGMRSSTVGITLTKGVSATTVTTDHQALDTYVWGGISTGATGSALPTNAGLAGYSDGANTRAARVYDLDSDGGTTAYVLAVQLRIPGSGDSVAAQGQKAMASSIPVVIASDQTAVAVTSTQLAARTIVAMTALAPSLVINNGAATAYSCAGYLDSTATTAVYYVQLINAAAAVDSGGAITPIAIIKIAHTSGTTDYFDFSPYIPSSGVTASTGIVVQLSSTLGTGTLAGSFLIASGTK